MRLAVSVNGRHIATAATPSKGYLSAHLTLSSGFGAEAEPDRIGLVSIDTSDGLNNTHLRWPSETVRERDLVQVELLPAGESDPPESTLVTSDRADNLLMTEARAKELVPMVEAFNESLLAFLESAREDEAPDEFRKLVRAVGSVLAETDRCLLSPTWRRHTSLIPEDQKGNLL